MCPFELRKLTVWPGALLARTELLTAGCRCAGSFGCSVWDADHVKYHGEPYWAPIEIEINLKMKLDFALESGRPAQVRALGYRESRAIWPKRSRPLHFASTVIEQFKTWPPLETLERPGSRLRLYAKVFAELSCALLCPAGLSETPTETLLPGRSISIASIFSLGPDR